MRVEIGQRKLLHMCECLLTHAARDGEAHTVIQRLHHPLTHSGCSRYGSNLDSTGSHHSKIHLPGRNDIVDRITHKNRNIQ